MDLPTPIAAYFEADQIADGSRLLDAFASEAVVKDEGVTHLGHNQIASWWRLAKDNYDHRARPAAVEYDHGTTVVLAEVTGNFPGSPAMLSFAFQLEGDLISSLEIGA